VLAQLIRMEKKVTAVPWKRNDDLKKYFDQFSEKYTGPIHKNCKPKYKLSDPFYPVVFYYLSKYTIHLIITELEGDLSPIPCINKLYIALAQTIIYMPQVDIKQGRTL